MKVTATIDLSVEQVAAAFCEMDDDAQARFFVECAKIAATWRGDNDQFFQVGHHLRTCSCSTEEARELIRRIVAGMEVP